MSKQPKNLGDLFYETLRDVYFAEKKILRSLPLMAKNAQSPELRHAFETHYQETEGQIERLEQIFDLIGKSARTKTCEAIVGLLDEGQEVMEEFAGTSALDAGILAAAQTVEHYEISRYGTLKMWAEQLGYREAMGLLDATLTEEKKTDALLTKLAAMQVNLVAA